MIALERPPLTPGDLDWFAAVLREPVRPIPSCPAYAASALGRVACLRLGASLLAAPRILRAAAPRRLFHLVDEAGRPRDLTHARIMALAWPESAPPPAPHHRAKHTPARVAELKALLAAKTPLATAARLLGIPLSTARAIAENRTWRNVPPAPPA